MRKYRFQLEPVLRVRTVQEDLARAALAQANHRVVNADAVLAARASRYSSMAMASGMRGTTQFLSDRFVHEMAARSVRDAEAARRQAEQEAAERREAWSQAAKEVSVLERLDERRRAEHALESARQADAEVDDIVVSRFGRNQQEQDR
jgi:flagellar export protein FliJ